MKKHITIEEALSASKIIRRHGIQLQAFFMVGFPQETEKTLNDTLTAIKKIKADDIIYSIFTPYPGTEAYDYCRQNGLIDENYDVSLYNHQSPANCFCGINHERFRILVSKIERLVDRENIIAKARHAFSKDIFWKLRERIRDKIKR